MKTSLPFSFSFTFSMWRDYTWPTFFFLNVDTSMLECSLAFNITAVDDSLSPGGSLASKDGSFLWDDDSFLSLDGSLMSFSILRKALTVSSNWLSSCLLLLSDFLKLSAERMLLLRDDFLCDVWVKSLKAGGGGGVGQTLGPSIKI